MDLNYNSFKRIPKVWTREQIELMIDHLLKSKDYLKSDWGEFMRWRDICLIATAYYLALRPSCVTRLMFEDFDIERRKVYIRAVNNKEGKARTIPIPSKLFKYYEIYFTFSRVRFWKGSQYMFPSAVNNRISSKRFECNLREKVLKPLGLWEQPLYHTKSDTSAYRFRHSRASHIAENMLKKYKVVDLLKLKEFLGHTDVRSTMVYVHTTDAFQEYLRDDIDF